MEGQSSGTRKFKFKRKSFTKKPNLEEIEVLTKQKGLEPETERKRKCVRENFEQFLKDNDFKTLDQFCEDSEVTEFQIALCSFFDCYTVGETDELPKRNYIDNLRSHLRMIIKEKTLNRVDINDKIAWPKFNVSKIAGGQKEIIVLGA